jgi:hypothetical protein
MTEPIGALPDMYVLDSIADDIEDIEQILLRLNRSDEYGWLSTWGRPFLEQDVTLALLRLIKKGWARASVLEDGGQHLVMLPPKVVPIDLRDAWFGITPTGRLVHANWDP